MSRGIQCPFCAGERNEVEEIEMKFDPPNLFAVFCGHCGAQGPVAITRGAALVLWDGRLNAGEQHKFMALEARLSGASGKGTT